MPDEVKPNADQASTQDAQLAAEEMKSNREKAPKVDIDKDYEASKQYSVSDIDRSEAGAQAADAATQSSGFQSPTQSTEFNPSTNAPTTGDPADYTNMAKDVQPENEGAGNVSDDLVKKALEKGKPGQ